MSELQLGIKITADGGSADMEFNKIRQRLNDVGQAAKSIESNLSSAALVARSAFAAIGTAFSARQLIETTDAYTNMNSKLKLVSDSVQEYTNAQKALFSIAQSNKTGLNETVSLYSRIALGMKDMGSSQAQILKVVDSVGKALKISGASTSEAASVTTQLSQALASGTLRGEEFNSVMENGPRLARAIADGLKAPIGSLREMAKEGKLTSDQVIQALESQSSALSQEAASMQTTVGQAWQMLENAATSYIGEADQANGTSRELASTIELIANNFSAMVDPAIKVVSAIAKVEVGGWLALSEAIASAKVSLMEMIGIQQAGTADPEVQKLMKMGKGQVSIDELAGKQEQAIQKSTQRMAGHYAKSSGSAKKAASDAEAAFKATLDASVKAAEDAAKLFDARAKTSAMRFENERKQAEETARVEMKAALNQEDKLRIAEELRTKQQALIAEETRLKEEQLAREEAALMARIAGVNQEIEAADRFNLKQSERIRLQSELQSLSSQQQALPEEKAQIELESMAKLAEISRAYNEVRMEGEANVREEALRTLGVLSSNLEYAKEMASGLSDAFGSVGTAIGDMAVALAEYAKQQETIRIQAEEAIKKNPGKQYEIEQDAALKQSRNQIKTYGDLTQAAQGFFKKGTKGYESLGAAVKVFRAFEMAQSAFSMAKQIGDMSGILAQFLGMEASKTTAKIASNTAQQASDSAGAVTSATKAVADASQGDPYTGIIRGAAMLAFLAALGIGIGGGGGGSSSAAAKPIDTTGMGTVKGDPTAISQSISESLQILVDNSSNDLNYSAGMLQALLDIKTALGGVADLVATDLTPLLTSLSAQFGADNIKQAGFLFDSQRFSKVYDSGLLKGSIGARIESSTDILGMSIKKGQTLLQEYGKKYQEAFGQVIRSIADGIMAIGETIGLTDQEIKDRLKNFRINLGTIDIAGLSAEEAAKKIEAAFSAMSDTMAKKALPEFKDFQQVGEGYFETITRVAEGINRATGGLELLGMEAINYADIINKQGDVAAEITRQTLMAQGDLSEGTRKYVEQLTGSAEDIVDAYKKIVAIENLMRAAGLGIEELDRTTINAAGGLDALTSALEAFYDNYLNDDQKVTAKTNELTAAFARLGYALPQSKEEFYRLVSGIDRSTEAGKKLFAQMLGLSQGFSDLQDAISEQTQAAQEAADAARKQQEELRQAEVNRLKDIQKQQDDLAAQAQKNYDAAATALSKAFDDLTKVQQRFETISQNIQAYYAELTGSRSPIASPEQRYRLAQAELGRVRALAIGGDETALNQLVGVSKEFLDASREYNASSEAYQRDYQDVLKTLEDGQSYAESQVNLAQEQLNFAKASYTQLVKVDASVLSITGAVGNLTNAMSNFAQASIANSVAAANAAAAAAQVAAAAASQVANASSSASSSAASTIINNKPPAVMTPPRTVASPATGYIPTKSAYRWNYDHAAGMARFYYQQLLGRDPENEQVVAGIANQLANAYMSEWDIVQSFRNSAEYRDLVSKGFVPGFAKGGLTGTGFAVVGEHGPELIDFKSPARVYTASETEGLLSGAGSSQKLEHLTDAVSAGIRVDQAGYRALADLLTSIDERLSSVESANKLAGAAV